jgi:hypothetical protein
LGLRATVVSLCSGCGLRGLLGRYRQRKCKHGEWPEGDSR